MPQPPEHASSRWEIGQQLIVRLRQYIASEFYANMHATDGALHLEEIPPRLSYDIASALPVVKTKLPIAASAVDEVRLLIYDAIKGSVHAVLELKARARSSELQEFDAIKLHVLHVLGLSQHDIIVRFLALTGVALTSFYKQRPTS